MLRMIILITGATAGFGLAIARRFGGESNRIIAVGRRKDRLDALVKELGANAVHPIVLDVRDRAAIGAALAALFHMGGGWPDFRDAVLEIGASSVPLLLIARRGRVSAAESAPAPIRRSGPLICVVLAIYALFVATLGRGLYF